MHRRRSVVSATALGLRLRPTHILLHSHTNPRDNITVHRSNKILCDAERGAAASLLPWIGRLPPLSMLSRNGFSLQLRKDVASSTIKRTAFLTKEQAFVQQ
ncbi:hypothetical protein chiPu_0011395 [Chiloscyllium punctatum]|uniref:Uncharacterized protein n=1 Tax=Chiloscyllium punctatum TaxID=137246 RepID=A0A401SRA9_CHIPU|nr:hypothetical protein [Chiloscyllium punctatum]